MKIVDREAFLASKPGTLFCKVPNDAVDLGEPMIYDGSAGYGDFYYTGLVGNMAFSDSNDLFDIFEAAFTGGEDLPITFKMGHRDGLFDHDQKFGIYSLEEVDAFIAALQEARARMTAE